MSNAKKTKIDGKYQVKVFNNTGGGVSFQNLQGQWIRIQKGGFALVDFEVLENLKYGNASFLNNGYIFIGDKYAREALGIDAGRFVQYRYIKDYILNKSLDELAEILKNCNDITAKEFGNIAYELRESLPNNKLKLISGVSGIELIDTNE